MAYSVFSVVAFEQPTAAKWNLLGSNDAYFNTFGNWTQYTPTVTGFTSPPSMIALYSLVGKFCKVHLVQTDATSNATTISVTAPFSAATLTGMVWMGTTHQVKDNGTNGMNPGRVQILSAGTAFSIFRTSDAATPFTNSGTKNMGFCNIDYQIA